MPRLYMIGGPNGAGKTTSAMALLPNLLECYEYINADAIAAALSPFAPDKTAMQAGRLMLQRIHQLAQENKDFAFETTMSSRTFSPFLKKCKQLGYQIELIFLWLQTPALAIERVNDRVQRGGHFIPEDIVKRRYKRCIANFLNIYTTLANSWFLYDNSYDNCIEIAEKKENQSIEIKNIDLWKKFRGIANEKI